MSKRALDMGRFNIQDRHEECEPKLLRAEKRVSISPPLPKFDVVDIAGEYEYPGHLYSIRTDLVWVEVLGYLQQDRAIQ